MNSVSSEIPAMILSFGTDRPVQTVVPDQTALLLKEQSDQGTQLANVSAYVWKNYILFDETILFKFCDNYSNFLGVQIIQIFTVPDWGII